MGGPPIGSGGEPQPPILLLCGQDFLDVHRSVESAARHLAADVAAGDLDLNRLDAFDATGRVLDVWTNRRGGILFTVRSRIAEPGVCLRRVAAACEAARHPDHAEQREANGVTDGILDVPTGDLAEAVAALADTFDAEHHPPRDGHVGSRLHNFWHAIAG